MDVAVADLAGFRSVTGVAAASGSPSAGVWDPAKFLDIDVDQLTSHVTLIAANRFSTSCTVATIQTSHTRSVQDVLHR